MSLITNKEYKEFNPEHPLDNCEPVTTISHQEAKKYAEAQGSRLPTVKEGLHIPQHLIDEDVWEMTSTKMGTEIIYHENVRQGCWVKNDKEFYYAFKGKNAPSKFCDTIGFRIDGF